jgi:hypothetical protein
MSDSSIRLPIQGGGFVTLFTDLSGDVHTLSLTGLGVVINLSPLSFPENTATGAIATATLSGLSYTGTPTYTLGGADAAKFSLDGSTGVLSLSTSFDYEVATSHAITIAVSGTTPLPLTTPKAFTISVTNVFEAATLNALTLDTDEITSGDVEDTVVGALQDTAVGSTLSMIDTAGGRFKLSGSNVVAGATATDFDTLTSHNITVRETLADSSNSPRDSVIAITVLDDAAATLLLTHDSVSREVSPEFTFDYSLAINTGDVINLEIDSNIDFSTATQHDYTALSDGLDAVTVDFPSITLTAGTWYARANVNGGAWSNTVTFIISPGMFGARHFGGRYFAANHIGG